MRVELRLNVILFKKQQLGGDLKPPKNHPLAHFDKILRIRRP